VAQLSHCIFVYAEVRLKYALFLYYLIIVITIINFCLKSAGKDYHSLATAIKAIGSSWYRLSDSAWLINARENPEQIKETLARHLRGRDELFVAEAEDCSGYLSADAVYWLEENINSKESKKITSICQRDK